MAKNNSPLRYPGGKAVLTKFLADVVKLNGVQDGIYVEPFAGGAGAALNLLFADHVSKIIINDADVCIYAFWKSITSQHKRFVQLILDTGVSIDEWYRQRDIYLSPHQHSLLKVGFSTFYLNRCNRSGILRNGGPIGGFNQNGNWKIDARFNKPELISRLNTIYDFKDRIDVFNMDAVDFLKEHIAPSPEARKMLVYLDPPYYAKGGKLYMNHYVHDDHAALAKFINRKHRFKWIMSYDNVPHINEIYSTNYRIEFNLNYSAHKTKLGSELIIYGDDLTVPQDLRNLSLAS